jgi:hypothetical protein
MSHITALYKIPVIFYEFLKCFWDAQIVTSRHARLNGENEPVNSAIMRRFKDSDLKPS